MEKKAEAAPGFAAIDLAAELPLIPLRSKVTET